MSTIKNRENKKDFSKKKLQNIQSVISKTAQVKYLKIFRNQ